MKTNLERALFSDDRPVDLARFWIVVDELEHRPAHGLQKYNPFQVLRLRYYHNGTVAHTFKEIGAFYGVKPEYARHMTNTALRALRHPRWQQRFISIM